MTSLISKAFEGNNIRIITDQHGEPWFVAADIAKVLLYRNAPDMTRNLDDDEKVTQIVRTPGGNQEMNTINESGLYSAFLCAKRYMYQLSGQWMAYAQHLDAGRFEVKTGTAEQNNYAFAKTVFTPKGVQWIAGEWGKHKAEKELNCQAIKNHQRTNPMGIVSNE